MAINYLTVVFATVLIGVECRSMILSNLNQAGEQSESYEASKENVFGDMTASEDFDYVINLTKANEGLINRISKEFPGELSQLVSTQGLSLEKLLSEIVTRAVNDTEQAGTAAQWLKLLKRIQDALSNVNEIDESSIDKVDDIGETESTLHDGNENFILIGDNNWLDDFKVIQFLEEQYIDSEGSEDNDSYVKSRFNDSSTSYSLVNQSSEEIEDDMSNQQESEQSDDMVDEFQNDISGIQKYFEKLCRKHRTAS